MKRIAELRDLSDDHHTGLVLAQQCKRLARAKGDAPIARVWEQVCAAFADHLEPHFRIEEEYLLPALEAIDEGALAERIRADHAALREHETEAAPTAATIEAFGRLLEAHIRFEEREVFEPTQHRLAPEALRAIASACEEIPRGCDVLIQGVE